MPKENIPQGALRLMSSGAEIHLFKDEGSEKIQMQFVPYSGGLIEDHYYWGDLAIDLQGMKFAKKVYPILENHRTDQKIAFSKKPSTEGNKLSFNPKGITFVDTEESLKFQKLSQEGFPYEGSIFAVPSNIERLEKGATAMVNGFKMKGPGVIWRQSQFKEASVCVFGYDDKTEAKAFSKEVIEIEVEEKIITLTNKDNKEVKNKMDLETLKKDDPELLKSIEDAAKLSTTESVTADLKVKFAADLEIEKAKFSGEKEKLEITVTDLGDKVLSFEKKDTIRTAKENRELGEKIWTVKLSASEVPEDYYEKVSKHVTHGKFTKDEILDEQAFSDAVDKEIESWIKLGIGETSVLGSGPSGSRETDEEKTSAEKLAKENSEMSNTLLSHVGQKEEKE